MVYVLSNYRRVRPQKLPEPVGVELRPEGRGGHCFSFTPTRETTQVTKGQARLGKQMLERRVDTGRGTIDE